MMRSNAKSLERRKLRDLIKEYSTLGYEIFAEYKGYQRPEVIAGFVPDLIAKKGDQMIIVEIATKKDLPSLRRKMEQLSKYADQSENIRFDFVLTNPKPKLSREEKGISNEILLQDIQNSLLMDSKELYDKGRYAASTLMLNTLLENVLREFAIKRKAISAYQKISMNELTMLLRQERLISESNSDSIKRFTEHRNKIIHEFYKPNKAASAEFIKFVSQFLKKAR